MVCYIKLFSEKYSRVRDPLTKKIIIITIEKMQWKHNKNFHKNLFRREETVFHIVLDMYYNASIDIKI